RSGSTSATARRCTRDGHLGVRHPRTESAVSPIRANRMKGGSMSQTLSVEQRVAVARDFVSVVFNGHHPERAGEYFTSDVVWHGGSLGTVSGVENMTGLLTGFLEALPDLRA